MADDGGPGSLTATALQLAHLEGEIGGRFDSIQHQLGGLAERFTRMESSQAGAVQAVERLREQHERAREDLGQVKLRVAALEKARSGARQMAVQFVTWVISVASLGVATWAIAHR